jgi:hypothetical protein
MCRGKPAGARSVQANPFVVPSTMVESMGMGGLLGAAALRQAGLAGREEMKS